MAAAGDGRGAAGGGSGAAVVGSGGGARVPGGGRARRQGGVERGAGLMWVGASRESARPRGRTTRTRLPRHAGAPRRPTLSGPVVQPLCGAPMRALDSELAATIDARVQT